MVVVTVPLSDATRGLIGSEELAMMRPTAHLINVARGPIVDERALYRALVEGTIAGAGLDVWKHEPRIDPRLLALPNVVMLPHMGSATFEGRIATGDKVIQNIRTWADGHRPPDLVLEGWA